MAAWATGMQAGMQAGGAAAVPASAAINEFWGKLRDAGISEDGFLQLAPDTYFLGDPLNGSCLFVREPYRKVVEQVLHLWSQGITKLVITGSPGIGKSVFGWYLIWVVRQQGDGCPNAIVLDQGPDDVVFCFLRDGRVLKATSRAAFEQYTSDACTWLIVDGHKPPLKAAAKTILITSPDRTIWWQFHKERGATVRYMPAWDKAELEACRAKMYGGSVTCEKLEQLFSRWGGRPRYVLEKANDAHAQASLEDALARTSVTSLVHNLGGSGKDATDSDMLLEMKVLNEEFNQITYAFASKHVEDMVLGKVMSNYKNDTKLWCLSATEPLAGGLRGVIFEPLAHEALQGGGEFDVRELKGMAAAGALSGVSKLLLAPSPRVVIYDNDNEVDVLEAGDGVYCKPRRKNEAAVDAIIQPDKLLQFTVSGTHSINMEGLQYALGLLRSKQGAMLIFVVPPDRFDTFKQQRVASRPARASAGAQQASAGSTGSSSGPPLTVQQYVLKMDFQQQRA